MTGGESPSMKRLLSCAAMCLLGSASAASAEEPTQSIMQTRSKQFVIVAGGSSVLFDSSFKYLDKETGNGFFLDPEGQLDLPKKTARADIDDVGGPQGPPFPFHRRNAISA